MHDITQLWGMCIIEKEKEEDSRYEKSPLKHVTNFGDVARSLLWTRR